ncbi:hypothetical protein L2E82_04814 [Cichorium intybus]|uniref:Uncharacterized protein n=1 Tax=Cichorium intybus TaxID=13427 RepID=A0ACB9H778_CICIN|nr:hypothetical protein L2E82_04814 [Cichorium intybus]
MEAGLRSRKRKHQSSKSGGSFTRSKSQIYVHRHRSGYARADSVRVSNPLLSLEGRTKSLAEQDPWGCTARQITSEVSVKDLRARRVFSPTTITDEDLSDGAVDLKADVDVYKTDDGNPNVSSPEGDLGVSSSVAIDPKPSSENMVDSVLVSQNNAMEAEEVVKTTPRVSESDQNKRVSEANNVISAANETVDNQVSISKSQSLVTTSRSKKKVFISRGSYNSYRRLLPYLTDLATDDSPNFEIVNPTTTKVQKTSTIVSNILASKDKEIDALPNNNLADGLSTKTSEKVLSDVMEKSHEDVINNTLEECEQMTPPDSDIYSKPNIDKSSIKICNNESNDSISSSKLVLKSCSRMKMLQTPTSFSHRRLLPFLMSVSGDDSWASNSNQPLKSDNTSDQNQQSQTPSLLNSDFNMNESLQPIEVEKSDSPTSTLTPIETPFDSTPIILLSNNNLSDTKSTSQIEVKLQDSVMKLEQESPIKDSKCVEETTSNLQIVPSIDTSDNQKSVNESTHESLLQIAPLNSPGIVTDNSRNGILKRTPRGCRGICNCLNCTSFRLHAERSFEFSRNQMHDAEEVALELINDLTSLRNILERTTSDSNDTVKDTEVKEVCAKALYKEEVARARLAQMNEDLSFHCRSMTLLRPKVTFANKIEEKVISDKKIGER